MAASGAAFSAFLADVLGDDGFYPGLKPRPHAGTAAEFLAAYDREGDALLDADALEPAAEPAADELWRWQEVELELSRRREKDEIEEAGELEEGALAESARRPDREGPGGAGEDSPGPSPRPAGAAASGRAGAAALEGSLDPEQRRNRERLAAARREVEAFAPANVQQRQLVALLRVILGHMGRSCCQPGRGAEFERWWRYAAAYRRALDFPEITGPRRKEAFDWLIELKPRALFAVARQRRMGSRMPNRNRGKSREKGWRFRCVLP